MTAPTIRAELAAAIRAVNARFGELPAQTQDRVEIIVDREVDAALLDDDRERALSAIADWRDRQLAAIEEVTQ